MMLMLTDTSKVVLMLSALVEVVNDKGGRECLGFLDACLEAHPLLGVGALIEEVIKVLCILQS